ncbi:hypothetical protein CL614_00855 [archaeon]|nr:hypothetical protein [archaeon]|tara:strand:+ start:284 stop:541 length:258 start_codon:yes stop_codon:yes gene_type:complete
MFEVKPIEKKSDVLRIELSGRNYLTIANVLNDNLWKKNITAAYTQKHPQIKNVEILVKSASPKAKLVNAADQLSKDAEALKKQVK